MDLQRNVLSATNSSAFMEVEHLAGSVTGLFEGAEDHYGEVWYEMAGQRAMTRSTIESA
jgi:hypothetical protein